MVRGKEEMKKQVLFSRDEINGKVKELGSNISMDYQNEDNNLLIISLLKGSFIFTADLVREITVPVSIEFMQTSSYGSATESSGKVKILTDFTMDLSKYDVLIVDDILDTGYTMKTVYEFLENKNPKSLKTCTFLDKPSRRQVEIEVDYKGFVIEDKFVVGYGLNYGQHFRNIPYIFEVIEI
jgi:hypoxanthine phosphoribosyltransferase